jgi:MarR family transcriptional regulator for hemolysin
MEDNQFYNTISEIRILTSVVTKIAGRDLEQRLDAHGIGISGLQHGVMRLLSHKDYTISELSRKFLLNPSTLVPAVDSLERKGLVKRGQDPKDRRRTPLLLTQAGGELVREVPVIDKKDSLYKSLNAIGPETCQQLLLLLREVIQHMPEGKDILQEISATINLQMTP